MSVDFEKFDKMIDENKIKQDIEEANAIEYDDVPNGTYIVSIETMEIKLTKAGDKLMLSSAFKIVDTIDAPTRQNGRWIFFNRIIFGNRTTEKWNDGRAIKSAITFLKEIFDVDDLDFETYSKLAKDVNELVADYKNALELQVKYDANAFNPIVIEDVFEVN